MALEAAGLALGAAGLAGLFSSRVHCLELVDLGRAQKRDLALLHAKLENQKAIFVAWGQSIGLESSDDVKIALQKIQPLYHDRIVATMQQRSSSNASHVVRWTLKDRPRFCNFVDDFRDLNEELKKLSLSNAGTVLARDRIILAALDDLGSEELELIEEAGADQVSDIASEIIDSRTERMSECSRSVRTYFTSSERIDQLEACTEVALPGSLLEGVLSKAVHYLQNYPNLPLDTLGDRYGHPLRTSRSYGIDGAISLNCCLLVCGSIVSIHIRIFDTSEPEQSPWKGYEKLLVRILQTEIR